MRLSASDLETLRKRPFRTKLDLFVFSPRVVMRALVNNPSASKGDRVIPFDTVSTGSFASIEPGMTLLVGNTDGGADIGRIRIVSGSASQLVVSENSNIKWQDNKNLTVLRYWDLWPIFPRIISDPSNDENVIFYKDYDIAYSNQNFNLGTFANAGPHRPIFIENGTGTAYYSSTGTLNLLGNSLSYDWAFEGGNPTGSTSAHPGFVYYSGTGDYVTRLIVTDQATGQQDRTYRYVSVRRKIGEGGVTPIVRWEMSTLSGSRDEGGYNVEFTVYDPVDIDENCLIMLKADDDYGNYRGSLGGNYPNHNDIFFVGYIDAGSIRFNAVYNYITFTATSVTGMMKKMTGFSVSVESTENPTAWYQLRDMDARRAIYHYLKWHSTVLSVTDFAFNGTDYKLQYFDVDRTSLFDAVDNLMKSAYLGRLSADRQGKLWAEVDPMAYDNPTGSFVPVMSISNRDWMREPSVEEQVYDASSYIELGGIAYSGSTTGTFAALLSGAPGLAPSYHGSVEKLSGMALGGQTHLNQVSGNLWANRNQRFPRVTMEMSTPVRNLDIAPQEVVDVTIQPNDTIRGERIGGIYIPSNFGWDYDPQNQTLLPRLELVGVVSGDPGDTITIPETVEDGDFTFPEFSFPSFPSVILPGLPLINPLEVQKVAIHVKNRGIFYTENFQDAEPSWQSANINLQGIVSHFRNFEVTLGGSAFVQVSGSVLWYASSLGNSWSSIFDAALVVGNPESYPFPRGHAIGGFGVDRRSGRILVIGEVVVTIGGTNAVYPWYGTSSGLQRTSDINIIPSFDSSASQRFYWVTYDNEDSWNVTYKEATNQVSSINLNQNGSSDVFGVNPIVGTLSSQSVFHARSIESSNVVIAKAGLGYISLNNGLSYSPLSGTTPAVESLANDEDRFESAITNGDGTQIVIASNTYARGLCVSLNNGATWSSGTLRSSGTTSVWHVGGSTYIYGGTNNIYAIPDLILSTGSLVKTGNLRNLITGSFEVIAIRHYG